MLIIFNLGRHCSNSGAPPSATQAQWSRLPGILCIAEWRVLAMAACTFGTLPRTVSDQAISHFIVLKFYWNQKSSRLSRRMSTNSRTLHARCTSTTMVLPYLFHISKAVKCPVYYSFVNSTLTFSPDFVTLLNLGIYGGRRRCKAECKQRGLFLKTSLTDFTSGNTTLDGNFLLVSNLKDGVDRYAVPTLQRIQSYSHVILRNVPLQISVARQAGLIFVGGDDGFARIFDYSTGAYRGQLEHGNRGDQIIPVVVGLQNLIHVTYHVLTRVKSHETRAGCIVVTGSCFNGHSSVKVWEEGDSVRPLNLCYSDI